MSEIVDIITKITYLSDTKQLEQAHSQLTAIEKRIDHIVSTIRTLSTEWSKGNKENISSNAALEKQIALLKIQLDGEVKKIHELVAANAKLQSALARQGEMYANLQGDVNKTKISVSSLIESLTGGGAKSLVSSLIGGFGVGSAISIVTGLAIEFGKSLINTGDSALEAKDDLSLLTEELDKLSERYKGFNFELDLSARIIESAIKAKGGSDQDIFTALAGNDAAKREVAIQQIGELGEALGTYNKQLELFKANPKRNKEQIKALEETIKTAEKQYQELSNNLERLDNDTAIRKNNNDARILKDQKANSDKATKEAEKNAQKAQGEAQKRYRLQNELLKSTEDLRKQSELAELDSLEFIEGKSEEFLKRRLEIERKAAIETITISEDQARRQGLLDEKNAKLFAEKKALVNENYRIKELRATREFFINLQHAQQKYEADINSFELSNLMTSLGMEQQSGEDTFGARTAIIQKQTQSEINALDTKYNRLYEQARQSNLDTLQLAQAYETAHENIIKIGNLEQLKAYEEYYQERLALIKKEEDRTINEILANPKSLFGKSAQRRILQENLRVAKEALVEAQANVERVSADPNRTTEAIAQAADNLNQAKIGVKNATTAITEYNFSTVDKIVGAYKTMESTILGIMQNIYDRQIQLLDYEIEVRRTRVQEAATLAENGNVEILRSEQERLNQTMRERENAARKQQQINAIASASNSAVALTEAIKGILAAGATTAAEGGGVIGYVAGIIAAFAAVAGLYASVKSLEPVGAYKDGVIDFKGKGTGTSDSNLVRISKGESVITAKATQQYRPILEAMNSHKPLPIHHTEMPYKYRHQNNNNKQSHEITIADVDVKTLVTNERLATLVKVHERKEKARWK